MVFRWDGAEPSSLWLGVVGTWALALGLRGAVWHQLQDARRDRRTGVHTFGADSPRFARRLVTCVLFPVELLAFGALLGLTHSAVAMVLLPVQLLLERARSRIWGWKILVVASAPRFRLAMHEYYVVFYPLAFLVAAAARDPATVILFAAHAALFSTSVAGTARELGGALEYVWHTHYLAPRAEAARRISASRQNPVVSSSEPQR